MICLENELVGVRNFSVAVKRQGDTIKFLRKIVPGGVDESYGIEVAKLAGLPDKIIKRAKSLLAELEDENRKAQAAVEKVDAGQVSFEKINDSIVVDRLRKTNIDELSDDELRGFIKELTTYL